LQGSKWLILEHMRSAERSSVYPAGMLVCLLRWGSWISTMSTWPFPPISCARLSRVLISSVAVLASTGSVDARRHGRHYFRAIAVNPPAAEYYVPSSLERGRHGRYNRSERRRLPINILALVPPDWRKQPADPDLREHRYVSPQGDATIAFSGRTAEQESLDEYLRSLAFVDGEDVTYLRRERDWLVVFGFKDDKHERKFYRKVMLSCGGHRWRHLNVEYPVTVRGTLERLINDLSEVMDLTKNSGCDGDSSSSKELALSPEQQRCVYRSVPKFAKADLHMRLALGAEVPRDVKLFIFPGETLTCDARLANFRFVVVEDQIVIVDPADYSVVNAISP
jgi:hypothetical protein